jgi:23S rRNA pseudouridine1911/1915/1917 synthase
MSGRQIQVKPDQAGKTLQDFLAQGLKLSRNRAKALIDARKVFVNGHRVWMARHTLRRGDGVEVAVEAAVTAAPAAAPAFLYQDDDYGVVNKPAGRLSNGPESVEADLRTATGIPTLRAVHRLDRDTSGCLLMAKHPEAFDRAVELFRGRQILKIYHAIVAGRLQAPERTIEAPVEGERAVTHLQVLDAGREASHLKVKIETGRTHQIRRHLMTIGHPVLGDPAYGTGHVLPDLFRKVPRQLLHAACLQFVSPVSGKKVRVEAPLPADFKTWLRRLGLT